MESNRGVGSDKGMGSTMAINTIVMMNYDYDYVVVSACYLS